MQDRTQQTLDDLADLFLTGTEAQTPAVVAPPTTTTTITTPKPTFSERGSLSPQPTKKQSQPTPGPSHSPSDNPTAAAPPRLEAVLLGNLPGMAHVWLTQYAQLLAEQDGPVLLLTVNPDHQQDGQTLGCLEAELIEPRVGDVLQRFSPQADDPINDTTDNRAEDPHDWFAPFPQTGATRPPEPTPHDDLSALLGFDATRTAVAERRIAPTPSHSPNKPGRTPHPASIAKLLRERLADPHPDRRIATVLIYCDSHPSEIDRLLDVGVWTLLTGADPTAVAAARFALESLAQADPQATAAQVGVFVVGSPSNKSAAAAEQIAAAAESADLFDQPIAHLGHLPKMRPAAVRTLGNFPGLDAQWSDLIATLDDLETPENAAPAPREAVAETSETSETAEPARPRHIAKPNLQPASSKAPSPEHKTPAPVVRRSVLDDFFASARQPSVAAATRETAKAGPDLPTTKPTPPRISASPVEEAIAEPTDPIVEHAPEQAQFQTPPTQRSIGNALDRHKPDLPTLLADTDPALNLHPLPVRCPEHPQLDLALDATGRLHLLARLTDADHPRATLLSLTDARRWARKHRALLALTRPEIAELTDPAAEPVLHLFTDQPDRAVPLIAEIDPTLRLHLLQYLPLKAGPTWLATPLQTVS